MSIVIYNPKPTNATYFFFREPCVAEPISQLGVRFPNEAFLQLFNCVVALRFGWSVSDCSEKSEHAVFNAGTAIVTFA